MCRSLIVSVHFMRMNCDVISRFFFLHHLTLDRGPSLLRLNAWIYLWRLNCGQDICCPKTMAILSEVTQAACNGPRGWLQLVIFSRQANRDSVSVCIYPCACACTCMDLCCTEMRCEMRYGSPRPVSRRRRKEEEKWREILTGWLQTQRSIAASWLECARIP